MKNISEESIHHQKKLNEFINLVEKIEQVGIKEYISLPIIYSIGRNDSGKTSVIENLLNLDFLPKGMGVTTKRPVEISITHIKDNNIPYAILEELGSEKFYDFSKLESNIEDLFEKINIKHNQGIEDKPIKLKLYSSNLPSITIFDLPPIIRNPFNYEIELFIKDIITKYIQDESSIILCNINANHDFMTDDGLRIAKEMDTSWKRTIGIVTKIDIMDAGTNCSKLLLNEEIKLNMGYIGVINRTNKEIINKITIEELYKKGKTFFKNDNIYSKIPDHYLGFEFLIDKIMILYIKIIKSKIIKLFINSNKKNKIENIDEILDSIKESNDIDEFIKVFKENKENLRNYEKEKSSHSCDENPIIKEKKKIIGNLFG